MKLEDKLKEESDRSAFLIIGALLEGRLGKLILAKLVKGTDLKQIGASQFNNRINLAYSLGLIDASRKALYHKFREARNTFAHSPDFINIDDVKMESVFNSYPAFGEELDNLVREEIVRRIPDGKFDFDSFWTARRKFEFVFSVEINFLDSTADRIQRIE
ncbi:hypothetical protein SNE94_003329 [Vibrio cholerae]|nr:hypothetical protein [Vibrio cholerae]